jgi:hypothetical protein
MDSKNHQQFLDCYHRALLEAVEVVDRKESEGRNQIISLPAMFPHGASDCVFMIYMKIARSLGYDSSHNRITLREELLDIINYAGFAIALLDGETNENCTNPSDSASR